MPARSELQPAQHPPAARPPTDPPTAPATDPAVSPAGSVWASREYRALWVTSGWSLAGDQLARVALTVLLFDATGSAFWAAVGGAVTLLAPVVGGLLLSRAGDRWPRRNVMLACDLASAVLVAAMAIPAMPLAGMVLLLAAASLLFAPFNAARMALTRDVFPDNQRYATAVGINGITARAAILAGLLLGGAAVAVLGARGALLLDAATFTASALVVRLQVSNRPAARPRSKTAPAQVPIAHLSGQPTAAAGQPAMRTTTQPATQPATQPMSGVRLVFTDPVLRTSALYAWLAVFTIAPAGVAAPYAAAHGGGSLLLGALLAVQGAGAMVGTWALTRLPFRAQRRWLVPGAVLSCAPLIGTATDPGILTAAVLWALAGAASAYVIVTQTVFMSAVPNERRAEAGGLVSSILLGVQGVGMLAVAALVEPLGPAGAVAVFGAAGTLTALALAPAGHRLATAGESRQ